jgi:hypothetical protein
VTEGAEARHRSSGVVVEAGHWRGGGGVVGNRWGGREWPEIGGVEEKEQTAEQEWRRRRWKSACRREHRHAGVGVLTSSRRTQR